MGEPEAISKRKVERSVVLPPYDVVVDRVWTLAFPTELIANRTFERPLEWGVAGWSFSNHNEDCAAEIAVVKTLQQRRGGGTMRTLCVASAGETAAALAACAAVQEVCAADVVVGQVMLTQLRFAAMQHLSNADYRTLFGVDVGTRQERAASEPARLAVYEELRGKLPDDCRTYFDAIKDKDVAFAVGLSGKVEQWNNACHRAALEEHGKLSFYEGGLWRKYEEVDMAVKYVNWPPQWMDVVLKQIDFSIQAQGTWRLANKYLNEAVAERGGNRADDTVVAAAAEKLRRNHFLQLFHTGALGCGSDLPDCYSPDVQKTLQEKVQSGSVKVDIIQANIIEAAIKDATTNTTQPPWSFITLSNIFDFCPSNDDAIAQLAPLTSALVPGTAVMLRTNITWRISAEALLEGAGLQVDTQLTELARGAERSPMFGNDGSIAVGIVPPRAD